MRQFNAYTLEYWPRMKSGEVIFRSTEDAIFYANLVDDRLATYDLLKKWIKKTQENIDSLKERTPFSANRLFNLVVRVQFYVECMEEIQRLNEGK